MNYGNVSCCRFCKSKDLHMILDLGNMPFANSYQKKHTENFKENKYPLNCYVCGNCLLVQLGYLANPDELFSDYAYYSSYSSSWLEHARRYSEEVIKDFALNKNDLVLEIASNDGYLLKNFVENGLKVLGIEPAKNIAEFANKQGIETISEFFGEILAKKLIESKLNSKKPELVIGNNVLAHVPDINDFVKGVKIILAPNGMATFEFPHLLQLLKFNQFDTIYHEHYAYYSLLSILNIMSAHDLRVFDVQELSTHGGSLRIYVCHKDSDFKESSNVSMLERKEVEYGLDNIETYLSISKKVKETKNNLVSFLQKAKMDNLKVVAYGAPAKGNTLLNYCDIDKSLVEYTVDKSPYKQEHLLPGSKIPVFSPDMILKTKPDYILVLPWNLLSEIKSQHSYISDWGGRFVVPIPNVSVVS